MGIKEKTVSVVFALLLCAMVYSSFMQSVFMMLLVLLGFLDFGSNPKAIKISGSWQPITRLKELSKYSHFLVITIYFWIVLFSFWQVENGYDYFLERLRIKVPFLLIPLAYLGLPQLSNLSFHRILYFFMALMTISVLGVLGLYAMNFEEVNLLMKQGQHMATPCNHIRFSQLVALAIIAGWYLIQNQFSQRDKLHSRAIKIMAIILFVAIHILSVKTGLVCLYTALFVLTIKYIFTKRNLKFSLAVLSLMILLPLVAYKTVPSFEKKVHYTLYDMKMYEQGQGSNYGDSGRLTSLKVGVELFKKHPFLGVGAGNLKQAVVQEFEKNYPQYKKAIMPHNQFVFVMAGSGLLGLSFLLLAFFLPLLYKKAYRNDFYLGIYILFTAAFIIDHFIEGAHGVGIFTSFILLCLLYIHFEDHRPEVES